MNQRMKLFVEICWCNVSGILFSFFFSIFFALLIEISYTGMSRDNTYSFTVLLYISGFSVTHYNRERARKLVQLEHGTWHSSYQQINAYLLFSLNIEVHVKC